MYYVMMLADDIQASAPLARAPSPDVDGGTSVPGQQNGSTSTSGPSKHYVKTLRLTSDQLVRLVQSEFEVIGLIFLYRKS